MRSDALIGDRGAAGYKESTQGVGLSDPLPCVAEFVIRRGETAGESGGPCEIVLDHSDERVDRVLQQVIQADSLTGRFDRQHRPLGLGQADGRLERHSPIRALGDGAQPFAEHAGD